MENYFLKIGTGFAIIFFLLICAGFIWEIYYDNPFDDNILNRTAIVFLFFSIVFLGLFIYTGNAAAELEKEKAKIMIADGCEVYLDGQLVDANKINLRDYDISIKEDFVIISR